MVVLLAVLELCVCDVGMGCEKVQVPKNPSSISSNITSFGSSAEASSKKKRTDNNAIRPFLSHVTSGCYVV